MKDPDCIFCKIVSGEIPSTVVLDQGGVLAFRDVTPQAPTHVLVVPKDHIDDITDFRDPRVPPTLLAEMVAAANKIACDEHLDERGYRLVFNVGPDAGQTVFHLHLHVLGGRPMAWPPG